MQQHSTIRQVFRTHIRTLQIQKYKQSIRSRQPLSCKLCLSPKPLPLDHGFIRDCLLYYGAFCAQHDSWVSMVYLEAGGSRRGFVGECYGEVGVLGEEAIVRGVRNVHQVLEAGVEWGWGECGFVAGVLGGALEARVEEIVEDKQDKRRLQCYLSQLRNLLLSQDPSLCLHPCLSIESLLPPLLACHPQLCHTLLLHVTLHRPTLAAPLIYSLILDSTTINDSQFDPQVLGLQLEIVYEGVRGGVVGEERVREWMGAREDLIARYYGGCWEGIVSAVGGMVDEGHQ